MILVQRYPTALLETLGAKSGGQTPVMTDDNLQVSLDASEFYAQATAEVLLGTVSCAALGFNGTAALRVPAGEIWRVRSVSVFTAALGAGQTLDLQPAMQLFGTGIVLCGTTSDAAAVGVAVSVGWDFRTLKGEIGLSAQKVLDFVAVLKNEFKLNITTWDERLTTAAAERALIEAGLSRARRRQVIDQSAAANILQSYLDRKKK